MKTYKQKAEEYVREKCPELMELSFGCEVEIDSMGGSISGRFAIVRDYWKQEKWDIALANKLYSIYTYDIEKIIGHPIELQHWLRVLSSITPAPVIELWSVQVEVYVKDKPKENMLFNLTTGQPATAADYQAFCEIVGV